MATQRTTVVQKRHRNQVMSEQGASHSHQWKYTSQAAVITASREINALVRENALHHRAPAKAMKVCETNLRAGEQIPLWRRSAKLRNGDRHAAPSVTGGDPFLSSVERYDSIVVKLNSPSSFSIRPRA